jgi:hypothetical protein
MNNKKEKEKEKEKEQAPRKGDIKEEGPGTLKKNPNPRANENIPAGKNKDQAEEHGVGSEITDGEDG